MSKLLVFSHLYPSELEPGLGPFVRDQVVELARRGHDVTVVNPLQIGSRPARARAEAVPMEESLAGVRVVRSPRFGNLRVGGRLIGPWLWAREAGPVLRRESQRLGGADLVHAHSAISDGFAAARFAARERVPLVLTVHGSDVLEYGRQLITRRFVADAVRRADAVIAVSEELADRVAELRGGRSALYVLVGGIPYPPLEDRRDVRRELGLAEDEKVLLWVGGLEPVKQPLHAVEVLKRLCDPRIRLVLAGGGPLLGDITQAVRDAGLDDRVHLLGYVDRAVVWRWQRAADALFNCSRSEGTPIAVLEALGAGTPVASYPLPGATWAVKSISGGAIAETSTPEALAGVLRVLLAAAPNRDALASEARNRFSLTRIVDDLETIYLKTIADS